MMQYKKSGLVLLMISAMTAMLLSGCSQTSSRESDHVEIVESDMQQTETLDHTEPAVTDSSQEQTDLTPEEPVDSNAPVVYMTTEISPEKLTEIYEALGASPEGKIAVKLSTGEPGSNYLRTDLIGGLVTSFDDPTIVECNTAYGGSRSNTAMHYQLAEDHGYTDIADVDIMDEDGSMTLTVTGGSNLTENYVGANFANYD